MLSIATWNVNSIKSRLQHLTDWLRSDNAPDIVLLQEIKVVNENFPAMEIEELGYNIAVHGQKTYNGVAILSKHPIDDVVTTLPGEPEDEQARYIEAVISLDGGAVRVASIYVPNGQAVDSDKFQYKMRFFDRLYAHAQTLLAHEEKLVWGGDYNVGPYPEDVYDTKKLDGTVCYHADERAKFRALTHLGLYDAWRLKNPSTQQFSWWDYRGGSYAQNRGLRIDHLLLSPQAVDVLSECVIDESLRQLEKPSDHTPVICTLDA
ncbi:MAG: exodeoxyribonuclease III [Rickettsiales bacterium]|nr:exodeoxyribonuclease III [Rickettsiales bacterium]